MIAEVLVEISNSNVDKTFDYNVPSKYINDIKVGIRVEVPFGKRIVNGFVLAVKEKSELDNLKDISNIIDKDIVLTDELLELGKVVRDKTLSTLISAYQVMLPKALKAKVNSHVSKKYDYYYKVSDIDFSTFRFNDKQKLIIDLCKDKFVKKDELKDISISSLNTLLNKGVLIEEKRESYRLNYSETERVIHKLTPKQNEIYKEIVNYKDLKPSLIYGVTGSGKTEIYMELINHYLEMGKTALLLVPEISLTTQLINRFVARFGNTIAALHSALSDGERYDEYRRIMRGEVSIVIGARSAVFAPLNNIGVIIIDEEHSDSYKQSESNPRYNAKEVALVRSEYHKAKVVFGSATPSLETMARAKKGVFHLLCLMERVGESRLPEVKIIDMNKEIRRTSGHFSLELINAVREKVSLGEQVILLLNRRGYASFVTCKNCGYTFKCPNCDISLTYHKSSNTMRCHYCGYGDSKPIKCPSCGEKAINDLGVGTQRIEEELEKLVDAKVLRMDYDTTSRKGSHEKMINAFKNHEYDILLGTQMVSKGLDFPLVTLVGVINADTSLNIPDYNSSFNTFSLLNQVSGRAGRSTKPGIVYIQTYNKDHYAINLASKNDYLSFYEEEMKIRRILKYPPYYYLCYLRISGKNNIITNTEANKIKRSLDRNISDIILGPSPSILYKINNIYRYSIIIKYKDINSIRDILIKINDHYKNNKDVKIDVDFNPLHIL